MEIKLYNTLSKKKEVFKPIKAGQVSMYNCGPTVYDTPHIGNYRTFVMNDLLRRMLEYFDYKVDQVMNVTDVDDKTIKKSREQNVPLKTVTEKYEKLFLAGLKSLNILTPHHLIKATDCIQDMIGLVQLLIEKDFAYKTSDGIYMSIDKVKDYGKLAGLKAQSTKDEKTHASYHEPKSRVANDEYDKEDPRDFALWKLKTPEDGDNSWQSPFGEGRPGWHIECSAMAITELGDTIDIHTGGSDLIFPHHTNEIAQSESATGKKFANYWIHGGFMTIKEEKMSKSKGNIIKLEDLAERSLTPLAYRYWLLMAHYRSPVHFSFDALEAALNALNRLKNTMNDYPRGGTVINSYKERFGAYISDDLDMPKALALVWELLKDDTQSPADKRATILDFDRVFGLNLGIEDKSSKVPFEIQALVLEREKARAAKDWSKADKLRVEIENGGYEVKDTSNGVQVRAKL
ncbi:cysteine--tRNA ligase [Patescibacteria group bacterium]|nr:cysteine--tRNA ligase [Patescibacteria group bacterium]MDE1946527.1 cysteine--tRNA ligase [Patescibacteria group bacterium]MDE2010912.1 cysteine--tRNA ligase [Patescibacteria group bacterium]MDE2232796.1 cysteine--tRNA ligase [Patescibacteria group bacterium]